MLRPFYQKVDKENSCNFVYQKGAELAVEVVLSAPQIVLGCKVPASLLGRITKKN
jgi:hypothetical protein